MCWRCRYSIMRWAIVPSCFRLAISLSMTFKRQLQKRACRAFQPTQYTQNQRLYRICKSSSCSLYACRPRNIYWQLVMIFSNSSEVLYFGIMTHVYRPFSILDPFLKAPDYLFWIFVPANHRMNYPLWVPSQWTRLGLMMRCLLQASRAVSIISANKCPSVVRLSTRENLMCGRNGKGNWTTSLY